MAAINIVVLFTCQGSSDAVNVISFGTREDPFFFPYILARRIGLLRFINRRLILLSHFLSLTVFLNRYDLLVLITYIDMKIRGG